MKANQFESSNVYLLVTGIFMCGIKIVVHLMTQIVRRGRELRVILVSKVQLRVCPILCLVGLGGCRCSGALRQCIAVGMGTDEAGVMGGGSG